MDRSTVALYYSGNAMDWVQAGILDYHLSFGRHFTYPHMILDGEDLLVVMRATYAPAGDDHPPPVSPYGGYYKCVLVTVAAVMVVYAPEAAVNDVEDPGM